MSAILHSLGWAILALITTIIILSTTVVLAGVKDQDKAADVVRILSFLLALATFLLTLP